MFADFQTYIPMGDSEPRRFCDEDFQRYPAYLIHEDDHSIRMKGHFIDQGNLQDFQGPDHTIHDGDRDMDKLYDEENNKFQVKAIYNE